MPIVSIAIWRKTAAIDRAMMSIKGSYSETISHSICGFSARFFVDCSSIFRDLDLGAGSGFCLESLPDKSLVHHSHLDQLWNPGSAVFHIALSPVCAIEVDRERRGGDGYERGHVCYCDGCLLPTPCDGRFTRSRLECRCHISDPLPAAIHARWTRNEHNRYYCHTQHLAS